MMVGERWTEQQAWEWFHVLGWQMGANFVPSTASNQLEMWQNTTFDVSTIKRELGWASNMGYTTMRVFLHNLIYEKEGEQAYLNRIDEFLDICHAQNIRLMLVFFDACWDPAPRYGSQPDLRPHVHNSRWVQSPGRDMLENMTLSTALLKPYVQSVLSRFGNDTERVLLFDLFNEPDNSNFGSYGNSTVSRVPSAADAAGTEMSADDKVMASLQLLNEAMQWAREIGPIKTPLTVAFWPGNNALIEDWIAQHVDVISFHNYHNLTALSSVLQGLHKYGRPVICSEYMARPEDSTFDPILGYLESEGVWAYNWGFVSGKSQTIYPWNSWTTQYLEEPKIWFHDVLKTDGTPFNDSEYLYIGHVNNLTLSVASKWEQYLTHLDIYWIVLPVLMLLGVLVLCLRMKRCFRRRRATPNHYISGAPAIQDEDDEDPREVI